ncbi:MAG: HD-GYP domain-containing protein [Gaiellaceae bacterium]
MLDLPEAAAQAILALDEHWDGKGHPLGLAGEEIPLLARILGLAQTVEVFYTSFGLDQAIAMALDRSDHWFDPELVQALISTCGDAPFWTALRADDIRKQIAALEPAEHVLIADEARLDRVAEAFAQVIDAKSPYTFRHSARVAAIAVETASSLGFSELELRDLRRAALLHDIGKLGISNLILDKPGALTVAEMDTVRRHPELTQSILNRVERFRDLAEAAASHHEKLDGSGYHRGLVGAQLSLPARVLAVADIFEALTADRPYRGPMSAEQALALMRPDAGPRLCAEAFAALEGKAELLAAA